jgi:hypothetical protein
MSYTTHLHAVLLDYVSLIFLQSGSNILLDSAVLFAAFVS